MRSDDKMFAMILKEARADPRVRACILNGSRANPAAPRDIYQDFDIVYVVTETRPYWNDAHYIDRFGPRLIVQEPELLDRDLGRKTDFDAHYNWLILFADGMRLDLTVQTLPHTLATFGEDSLTVVLLDKDNALPLLPPASDASYHTQAPTRAAFVACCNDFWWCGQNVVKGILRDELPYAHHMLEDVLRPCLDNLCGWWVGMRHDWAVSPGKMGKYLRRYLSASDWSLYERSCGYGCTIREALEATQTLFARLGREVAVGCGFDYYEQDEQGILAYMQMAYFSKM